eukprot:5809352-Amphidinium_carterae.1
MKTSQSRMEVLCLGHAVLEEGSKSAIKPSGQIFTRLFRGWYALDSSRFGTRGSNGGGAEHECRHNGSTSTSTKSQEHETPAQARYSRSSK